MKRISIFIYAIATTGILVSEVTTVWWLHNICKPLLMPSLLLYYLFSIPAEFRSRSVVLAIVLSFAGDVLLMNQSYFVSGLLAFLLAHVMYIFAYRQHQTDETENALHGIHRIRLAFPIILAATGLVVVLFPVLADLKIPVIIYAVVLALMVIHALFRYGRTIPGSFWLVFGGAVLFMISDSLLAINKFLTPVSHSGFYIMLSYSLAQFFIIRGLILHPQNNESQIL